MNSSVKFFDPIVTCGLEALAGLLTIGVTDGAAAVVDAVDVVPVDAAVVVPDVAGGELVLLLLSLEPQAAREVTAAAVVRTVRMLRCLMAVPRVSLGGSRSSGGAGGVRDAHQRRAGAPCAAQRGPRRA